MFLIFTLLAYLEEFNSTNINDINLYSILGLKNEASAREITRSYKRFLVKKQRSGSPSEKTLKLWKQTEFAYSILSEPTSKELYDYFGLRFINQTDFSVFGYQSDYKIALYSQVYKQEFDPFGGIIIYPLHFSLLDAMNGAVKNVKVIQTVPCSCPRGGTKCAKCRSSPFMDQIVVQKVELPPGAPDYFRIVVRGLGDSERARGASDVVFLARFHDEKGFKRNGSDLHLNVTISLENAIKGGQIEIQNIDEEKITINLTADDGTNIVKHGTEVRVPGKGLPVYDENKRGDLVIRFDVQFPQTLSEAQKKAIAEILPEDVNEYQ
ncbi:DnaJ domain containing protein [Tritrichomonas foetus]|uniref:DnaJ domain containing protein n=1 Tax=Tritrichomonas foetus TaxID=1144522 RepID=A0A1J4JHF5_9EUKA|nr:DnaJ domain containing protein [Tritrichomonas foetus]|eukprot:OHS96700.1 DnaJ domain containing protein [Tritrichomonas foetus]